MKTHFCRFLIVGLGIVLWTPLGAAQTPPRPPARSAAPGFPWSRSLGQDRAGFYDQPAGLCEDYPREDRTQAKLDRDFRVLRRAGARLLRVGIAWESIEGAPGRYDWSFWDRLVATAVRAHVTLLPYVCYTPQWAAARPENFWKQPPADPARFGAFMHVIASRYRGRVHSWELWNEPDNPDFWLGTADGYADLVRAGARGVREADPTDTVVMGGLADGDSAFGRTLLQQYRIRDTVGAVNFHGYDETWNRKPLEDYAREAVALSGALAGDGPRPDLWMAELGYSDMQPPTGGWGGEGPDVYDYQHTAAYQAAALFKCQVVALSTGRLSLTAWYRINDLPPTTDVIGDAENRHLGVVDVQGRPKPALAALRLYNTLLGGPTRCLDARTQVTLPPGSQGALHVFERRDGAIVVAGWLPSPVPPNAPGAPAGVADTRAEDASLLLPATVSAGAVVTDYDLGGRRVAAPVRLSGRRLTHIVLTGAQPFIATVTPAASVRKAAEILRARAGRPRPGPS